MKNPKSTALVWTFCTLAASVALACNVPVFRYALERWPADPYELVVLHEGKLSAEEIAEVDTLRQVDLRSDTPANFNVRTIEISGAKDSLLQDIWKKRESGNGPLLVTLYPRNAQEVPDRVVSVHPLSSKIVQRSVDSPMRQQLAKRLLSGDSAVWVFVPCGDKAQDEAALERLTVEVKNNQQSLKLPPQDELEEDDLFQPENPIELRLGFSIITVDRKDPKEAFFLEMLMGSEPDLESLEEPMAFPVIGRGRVLYALVGKGIFRDTVAMASRFVVGPCSCQVKEQNPGFDLLLAVDWDEKLGGAAISEPAETPRKGPILIDIPTGKK
ncbi:hypothetical protein OAG76_02970 [Rubripirellula sp.]|nr:hypothetical protein [Rubripirellula sp.]MDA9934586.1 hypothetical protein [Rubripirellula sp.]MDB4634346.1 hypothetical protein [Rubripirellula sp.]MDC0316953.1 hypothetical protein [bacterium]